VNFQSNWPMNTKTTSPVLINRNREKLLNCIIYFLLNTKNCGKTKLFKLLYFLDFFHFKETGKSVTGLHYNAWQLGPVPVELFHEFEKPQDDFKKCINIIGEVTPDGFFKMLPRCKFDNRYFSKREMRLLGKVAYIFKEAKTEDIVEVSHLPNMPWDKTIKTKGEYAEIDFLLALDESKESLSLEEAIERMIEIREVQSLFNND